ncbi:MAG: type III-A CRISPR-associated protein Cas10/Csm1 [Syntrophus sp. (in: bacteria)]|nr:type III-A CRISPR-associated protein Cas10/Csm1 [Syntrophus sp. (in: bacteria)]
MDETVLKIAIAGLMHDIGKFAEDALNVSDDYLNRNADLYQPFFNERHTHRHAVYTAAFIDHIEKLLPRQFNKIGWGLEDTFINLAAGHHKPKTPMQWIIAMADRISSGWDRNNFEAEYNQAIAWQGYKKTRLLPLFEGLLRDDRKETANYKFRYPLKEVTPSDIFPVPKEAAEPQNNEKAVAEYKRLFDEFIYALEKVQHRDENIELWFEHFESLMLIFTSAIPAARAGKIIPDVSLYDHSKSTAALATALYRYHADTNTMNIDAIKDDSAGKFLLIGGDFYGIQDFIFSDSGEADKRRSKILRGRSFAVTLFCELAADMICREIGIPSSSILLNAAGKFTIIAPNTLTARKAVEQVEAQINEWLIKMTCGENAVGISMVEASPSDFVSDRFVRVYDRLLEKMAERKYRKYDIDRYGGAVEGYLDSFDNTLEPPLCPYCGKRPSSPHAERFREGDDKSLCAICRDHIFLGENIVKESRIAVVTKDADIRGEGSKLLEPIFGVYQIAFIEGGLNKLAREGRLLKYWDISIKADGQVAKDVTARFINGYVPVYKDEDLYDERILEGKKSETKKLELLGQIKVDKEKERVTPKTFAHMACKALNQRDEGGRRYTGIQALGVLKADVDQLGMLISCGIREKDFTISRLATLSRQLNFFFAVYLPHLLKTNPAFMDVYTVFAGGDDLFLIGPWNRMVDLAEFLRERFAEYACRNPEIHFSAGISLQKPSTPLSKLAADAEDALKKAKDGNPDKARRGDCITLFGETATWDDFTELRKIAKTLDTWRSEALINNAMIFRLNTFIGMASLEKEVVTEGGVSLEDMECLKWRAMFKYTTDRNIGKQMKDEAGKKEMQREFGRAAKWLEDYGGRLKIALWDVIYNNR